MPPANVTEFSVSSSVWPHDSDVGWTSKGAGFKLQVGPRFALVSWVCLMVMAV